MEFKNGASIYINDGTEKGKLTRVAIDPETKEVTHIAIQKGFFSKEDKVIPIEKVVSSNPEQIFLNCTSAELDEMSPLEIEQEVPMKEVVGGGPSNDPLSGGVYLNPNPTLERSLIKEIRRTIPAELVVLEDDAHVLSSDDA